VPWSAELTPAAATIFAAPVAATSIDEDDTEAEVDAEEESDLLAEEEEEEDLLADEEVLAATEDVDLLAEEDAGLFAEEADFAAGEEEEAAWEEIEDDEMAAGAFALASRTAAPSSSSGSSILLRALGEAAGSEDVVLGIPFLGGTRVVVEAAAVELLATATLRAFGAALDETAADEEGEALPAAALIGRIPVTTAGIAVDREPGTFPSKEGGTPKPALMESRILV
jgi:hypothetical protein